MTIEITVVLLIVGIVAGVCIRYESMRKDSFKNKHDITGVATIARDTRDDQHKLQIMLFYLSLVACEDNPEKRQRVLSAMFEAATHYASHPRV